MYITFADTVSAPLPDRFQHGGCELAALSLHLEHHQRFMTLEVKELLLMLRAGDAMGGERNDEGETEVSLRPLEAYKTALSWIALNGRRQFIAQQ